MAYITAKEVAVIRADLKDAFRGWKFKVCLDSGHLGVRVHFMSGPVPLYAYGPVDGWRNPCHRDASMAMKCHQINHFYIKENHPEETALILNHVHAIITKEHWDETDSQIDYFNCAFYVHMEVGTWQKPYVCTVGQVGPE